MRTKILVLSMALLMVSCNPAYSDSNLNKNVVECTVKSKDQTYYWSNSFRSYKINLSNCTGLLGKSYPVYLEEDLNSLDNKSSVDQKYDKLKVNHRYSMEVLKIKYNSYSKNYLLYSYEVKSNGIK